MPADHAPPGRAGSALAFDTARERLILFGGSLHADNVGRPTADTWERTDGVWLRGSNGPATRSGHAAAFDSLRNTLVVFGGVRADGDFSGETWEYDGERWRRRYPTTNPAARSVHAMTFDRARGKTVMFGGANAKGRLDDLWEWDGRDWTLRAAGAGPSARDGHALSYDPATARSYLYGGGAVDDLWDWNGTRWTRHTPASSPALRNYAGAAFDEARHRLVVFGGIDPNNQMLADTWEYDGRAWQQIPTTLIVPARMLPAMAYDASLRRVVMTGGTSFPDDDRTWAFDGTRWTAVAGRSTPLGEPDRLAIAQDPLRNRVVALPYDANIRQCMHSEWDGTRWVTLAIAVPAARAYHALAFDGARGRTVLFGGQSAGALGDTWEFHGTRWSQAPPITSPPARFWHTLTYDTNRRVIVLHGGALSTLAVANDTWEYDGITWTQRPSITVPPARLGHAAAFDPARRTIVMTGGSSTFVGPSRSDAWEWDGRDWRRIADLPLALTRHAMVVDPATSRLVVAGGLGESHVFVLGANGWQNTTTLPTTRNPLMLVVDPLHGAPLAFGEARAAGAPAFVRGNYHLGRSGQTSLGSGGCASTSLGLRTPLAPYLGAPFELQIWDRLPLQQPRRHAAVAWLIGRAADLPIGPCRLAVDPTSAVFLPDATNAEAFASAVVTLPPHAALRGVALRAQAAIADPASPIGVTLSLSQELTIGG